MSLREVLFAALTQDQERRNIMVLFQSLRDDQEKKEANLKAQKKK